MSQKDIQMWKEVKNVRLVDDYRGHGVYDHETMEKGKVYEVLGAVMEKYHDGTGTPCYLVNINGIVKAKAMSKFEVVE